MARWTVFCSGNGKRGTVAAKSADDTGNQRNVMTSQGTDYDSDVESFRTAAQRLGQQQQQEQLQHQRDDRLPQLSSLDRYIYTDPRFSSQWNPYRRHPLLQKLLVSSISCSSSRVRSAGYKMPTFREMCIGYAYICVALETLAQHCEHKELAMHLDPNWHLSSER